MRTNPGKGAAFAVQLVSNETGPLVDIERVRCANPLFDSVLNILRQAVVHGIRCRNAESDNAIERIRMRSFKHSFCYPVNNPYRGLAHAVRVRRGLRGGCVGKSQPLPFPGDVYLSCFMSHGFGLLARCMFMVLLLKSPLQNVTFHSYSTVSAASRQTHCAPTAPCYQDMVRYTRIFAPLTNRLPSSQ
jgi:hypothetical protein